MIFHAEVGWITLIIFILWAVSGIVEAVRKHRREQARLEKTRQEAAQKAATAAQTKQVESEEDIVIDDASQDEELGYRSETKAPYEIVLQYEKPKPEVLGVSEESFSDFRPLATRSQRRAAQATELAPLERPMKTSPSSSTMDLHELDPKKLEQAFVFSEILSPSLAKRKERRLSLSSRWI